MNSNNYLKMFTIMVCVEEIADINDEFLEILHEFSNESPFLCLRF